MSTALLDRYYDAFARRDGAAMAACYAPDATFRDPVFRDLSGGEPSAMWRMLTARSRDLTVELRERSVSGGTGSARWVARYTFGARRDGSGGRRVVNEVRSTFRFRDGLIAEQVDEFSLTRWSRQALGAQGLLLGWTPFVRSAIRTRARAQLDAFVASERGGGSTSG